MIRKSLFFILLVIACNQVTAQFGLYASAVYMNINGSSTFYNNTAPGLGQDIGPATFHGTDFGVFEQNSGNLKIVGSEIKTYKGGSDNVCSGTLNYTVYPSGNRPVSPVFSAIILGFYSDCFAPACGSFFGSYSLASGGGCCSAGDQKWQNPGTGIAANIDLTQNIPGVYTLEVYYSYTGEDGGFGCGTTKYDNNNNPALNYRATFTITAPVPVSFGDIHVNNNGNYNSVYWKTYNEANTSAFRLERSNNAIVFQPVGVIPAAGFSNTTRNYSLDDNKPFNGINFYRVMMLEADGKFQYSKTVKTINNRKTDWFVANDPAIKSRLWIKDIETGDEIGLFTPSGTRVFTARSMNNNFQVNTTSYPAGVYFIRVSNAERSSVKQVIILK